LLFALVAAFVLLFALVAAFVLLIAAGDRLAAFVAFAVGAALAAFVAFVLGIGLAPLFAIVVGSLFAIGVGAALLVVFAVALLFAIVVGLLPLDVFEVRFGSPVEPLPEFPVFATDLTAGADVCETACRGVGALVVSEADVAASSQAAKGSVLLSCVVAGICCPCEEATAGVALTCDAILDTADPLNSI